ncbi:MAG: hypothetical protein ACPGR2_15890 [Psychrobium sp.]
MIDIGIIKNKTNYIASALHLPSNCLIKISSQSPHLAISKCLSKLKAEVVKKHWCWFRHERGVITHVSIDDFIYFSSTDELLITEFDESIEQAEIKILSIHQFSYEGERYSAFEIAFSSQELLIQCFIEHPNLELISS